MTTRTTGADVVLIGAGPAGLVATTELATAGRGAATAIE